MGLAVTVAASGCPGDDGGSAEETGVSTTTGSDSGTPMTSSGSTGPATGSSSGEGSSGPATGSSSGVVDSSSSGGGPLCDPPVVGEWNACIDQAGGVDNTLCNWMGTPDNVGFLLCLNSSAIEGANVCTIQNCVDACDCFNPPTTGTAEVICAPILANGDNACGLDCSAGQTCPDGMECGDGLCFWPPAA